MHEDSLEARVAVNTDRLHSLGLELDRVRDRLHFIDGERAAAALLSRQVAELREQIPHLARQAAREAVDELLRRRHADTLANWRSYAAMLSAGTALGALIVALVLR